MAVVLRLKTGRSCKAAFARWNGGENNRGGQGNSDHHHTSLYKGTFWRGRLGLALDTVRGKYGFGSVLTVREKMLDAIYVFEPRRGYVLKTASLTK